MTGAMDMGGAMPIRMTLPSSTCTGRRLDPPTSRQTQGSISSYSVVAPSAFTSRWPLVSAEIFVQLLESPFMVLRKVV